MPQSGIELPITVVDKFSKTLKDLHNGFDNFTEPSYGATRAGLLHFSKTVKERSGQLFADCKSVGKVHKPDQTYSENRMLTENFNINLDNTIQYTYADSNFLTQDKGVMPK